MCSMHAFSRGSTLAVDAGRVALHVYQGRFESHIVLTPERHCSIRLGRPCSCEHACASCVRRSCSSAENFIVPPSVPVDERCGGEPGPPLIAWFAPPGDPGIAKSRSLLDSLKKKRRIVVLLVFSRPSLEFWYLARTTPLRPIGPLSTGSPTAARRAENRFSHPTPHARAARSR